MEDNEVKNLLNFKVSTQTKNKADTARLYIESIFFY